MTRSTVQEHRHRGLSAPNAVARLQVHLGNDMVRKLWTGTISRQCLKAGLGLKPRRKGREQTLALVNGPYYLLGWHKSDASSSPCLGIVGSGTYLYIWLCLNLRLSRLSTFKISPLTSSFHTSHQRVFQFRGDDGSALRK